MSIDLNWEAVTGGPDGQDLAHKIRDFIHTKFQSVPLPRFIKSVTVHDFEFGTIPPDVNLKDITDPLPDFYEENTEVEFSDSSEDSDFEDASDTAQVPESLKAAADRRRRAGGGEGTPNLPPHLSIPGSSSRSAVHLNDLASPFLGVSTPGIAGGTSSLHYFHSQFANGLSGTQTPLAAVASAHHLSGAWPDPSEQNTHYVGGVDGQPRGHSRNPSQSSISIMDFNAPGLSPVSPASPTTSPGISAGITSIHHPILREKSSVSTLAPTSVGTSRPPTRDTSALAGSAIVEDDSETDARQDEQPQRRFRERRIEDMQAVFHIKYGGDIKLLLTADILLDYPMQSFVGIPLRLSITGLTFDGVGVLAYIRKRVHFCFLSPEDAQAAVGGQENMEGEDGDHSQAQGPGDKSTSKMGSLLQEIRVESEIGQRDSGKQSLKNLGKVERFVLEQVRRIFEEEFVYPSFWTFLV